MSERTTTPALRLQRRLRRLTWVLSAACVLYLFVRYDLLTLPEGSCSPLLRFGADQTLLIDRRPSGFDVGDAALYRGPDQLQHIGLIERQANGGFWMITDNPACASQSSVEFGPIAESDCVARILLAWPW